MADIIDSIESYAKLKVEEQKGTDVTKDIADLLTSLDKVPATHKDIARTVDYLTGIFGTLLQQSASTDAARFSLLVRSLEKNRVLSKDVLESIKDQLKAMNDEQEAKD